MLHDYINIWQTNPAIDHIPAPVLIRLICLHERQQLRIPVVINIPINIRGPADNTQSVEYIFMIVLALLEIRPKGLSVLCCFSPFLFIQTNWILLLNYPTFFFFVASTYMFDFVYNASVNYCEITEN